MTAIWAMLVDAYRELNAKRLFWVTLFLSGGVVLAYAAIGFNEEGLSLFFGLWTPESEWMYKGSEMARLLYRSIFVYFIVAYWLSWAATILALISTTTIFPDFMSGGSIDLVLAKPIGRIKLFLLKYLFGLLFVLLQVGIFCVGVFFCMGWRIGDWEPKIFAAIPLVTVFFSYLYGVNVLVGTLTRSALTALLLTILFWSSLFTVNMAEGILNNIRTQMVVQAERLEEQAEATRGSMDELDDEEDKEAADARFEEDLQNMETQAASQREVADKIDRWYKPIRVLQAMLPKTGETIGLLDRWFRRNDDINFFDLITGNIQTDGEGGFSVRENNADRETAVRLQEDYESRSVMYVLGSSLLFEAVCVGLACFVFCRRDY